MKGLRGLTALLALGLVLAPAAFAEEPDPTLAVFAGFHGGTLFHDLESINDWLDDAEVDRFPAVVPTFGVGVHGLLLSRILIGGRASAFTATRNGDDVDTTLNGGFGYVDLGYAAISSRRWLLAPTLGIGGAAYDLEVSGKLVRAGLLEGTNANHNNTEQLQWGYLVGQLGVSAYRLLPFSNDPDLWGTAVVGISAGGLFELSRFTWHDHDEDLESPPSPAFNGAFVQLEILFGAGTTTDPMSMHKMHNSSPESPRQ
jgi:hypothetical protein